jgi:hypothetical protein
MEWLDDPDFIKLLDLCTQQMRDQIAYLNERISDYERIFQNQEELTTTIRLLWLYEKMNNLILKHSFLLTDALRDKNYPITVVYCPN